ncbi:sugar ABC transporter ATP-binding protein [Vibrio kyushuensis]|uniref:sugar ABC transporter ATP-binding protein n=1 Tax=Vibrio kyushuensis TaxID=2910249 RepID=UPI003D14EC47
MNQSPLILKNIQKSFGSNVVLKNISFELTRGEVLGILGENGAGKSTLLKIISGVYKANQGSVVIEGRTFSKVTPELAKANGVAMIPQEFNLIPTLSVFENVFLGQEIRRPISCLLDKKQMRSKTADVLKELEVDLDPDTTIEKLSVAQKQMVEVAKVLIFDASIVIMDEPTTVLTDNEVAVLFRVIETLKKKGVTLLFISHKLKEIKQLCDRLLILRDGDPVYLDQVSNLSEHDMAVKMVGRELNQIYPNKNSKVGEVALTVEGLYDDDGVISNIALEVHKGEVLGLAGLIGSGRTEIAECLFGLRSCRMARFEKYGRPISINEPKEAFELNIALLSEDRQGNGLVMNFNLAENITLVSLPKYTSGIIDHKQTYQVTEQYRQEFSIKSDDIKMEVGRLSGGNQQKVYLAKLMDTAPDVLILDEPTRGIDVNAKKEIYHFVHSLTQKGIAVILISSELEEIIGLSHRVIVMRDGQQKAELSNDDINEQSIMFHAAGVQTNAPSIATQSGVAV